MASEKIMMFVLEKPKILETFSKNPLSLKESLFNISFLEPFLLVHLNFFYPQSKHENDTAKGSQRLKSRR